MKHSLKVIFTKGYENTSPVDSRRNKSARIYAICGKYFQMKILFYFLIVTAFSMSQVKATHIVGGELNYRYLGGNNYEIRLTVYRDCFNGVPPFDDPAALGVFDANNVLIQNVLMTFISLDTLPLVINSPCVLPPINVCYEVTTYIDTINLPPTPGGYQLAYQRCCRNQTILNIINPLSTGATYYATIPDTNIEVVNSNPVFNALPPPFICAQLPFVFDHSATDYDGDSLYYELFQPFEGATTTNPMPQPPNNPPYANVVWNPPFSTSDMLGGPFPLTINPSSGLLIATPGVLGQFVVGIKVKEYRNGVFLSETRRDFQFNVVPCGKTTVSALQAPNFSCESYTATFTNSSVGAGSFLWDFGDPTTANDTSSMFAPFYTYSDTGVFNVMLIAFSSINPLCNDTSFATVTILEAFEMDMGFSNVPCNQEVVFNSVTLLDSITTVNYIWDFGVTTMTTDTSSLQNPTYTYPNTGSFTVTLIAYSPTNTGCNDTQSVAVNIFPEFNVSATFTNDACSPSVLFSGSSPYDGLYPVNYFWDFGDASTFTDTANLANSTYNYTNFGNFMPVLIAYTDSPACADTTKLQLTIYPPFNTNYLIEEKECTNEVTFSANSSLDTILSTNYFWDFGDGSTSQQQNEIHTYSAGGLYNVLLTIQTSNGCSDTIQTTIAKQDVSEIFVPNAFTPNDDGENDILFVRGTFDEMIFSIYNRWGEKIFESTDQTIGWDGTYKGNLVDPNVFVYHLKTKCSNGPENLKKGNVTVIR